MNEEEILLTMKLAREIGGVTHIYDEYLDVAFKIASEGKDLTNVNTDLVKERACAILGLNRNLK